MKTRLQNTNLLTVGNSALKNPDWTNYAKYCIEREKGDRKEAFKYLDLFIKATESWTKEQHKEFIEFIFSLTEGISNNNCDFIPQMLSEKLIKPALENWCEIETTDSRPFRWYGSQFDNEDYLLNALKINPADEFARLTLINLSIGVINSDLHHLPEFYIGEPAYDLVLCERVRKQIEKLTSLELRDRFTIEIEEYLELINNYADWLDSGELSFENWGTKYNRRTGDETKTYYYDK